MTGSFGDLDRSILLVGEAPRPDATERALESVDARVERLRDPSDGDIREALEGDVDVVVVVSRSDVVSLRLAMVIEQSVPGSR